MHKEILSCCVPPPVSAISKTSFSDGGRIGLRTKALGSGLDPKPDQ